MYYFLSFYSVVTESRLPFLFSSDLMNAAYFVGRRLMFFSLRLAIRGSSCGFLLS